jgi:hypothetical protein
MTIEKITDAELAPYVENKKQRQSKTGINLLDRHLLYKGPSVLIVGGLPNVGKTTGTLWLMFLWSSLLKEAPRWLVFSSENENVETKVLLIEWFHEKAIHKQTTAERDEAIQWVDRHFQFMQNESQLSLEQLFRVAANVKRNVFDFDGFLVDPYSSLRFGNYNEHYSNAGKMRQFVRDLQVKLIVSMHVGTEATRRECKEGIAVPLPSHLEMGTMWMNRTDDLCIMHRQTQNQNLRDIMELHVCKIKSTRTGGRTTDREKPILMHYNHEFGGFSWDPRDPVEFI